MEKFMNKDFIRGMNAGSQPFADVFHKMQSECENMRLDLIGNLENMSRNVSDFGKYLEEVVIKNEFGINPEFDPAEILEKHECQYLVSVIFQISNEMFDRGFITSYEQKQFACSIMTYLEILEPQENIPLDTLGKIDSVKSLRCIMQIIMEYLFLYKGSSEFFNDKEFKKYTNIAHLKYSEIVDIIRNIERRFNLHGAEGFYEPYKQGAVIKQVKKQIQKNLLIKIE